MTCELENVVLKWILMCAFFYNTVCAYTCDRIIITIRNLKVMKNLEN